MNRSQKICKAIEDMWDCCEEIQNNGKCNSECPMHVICLMDTSFVEVADLLYGENVEDFIKYAENA